MFRKMRRAAQGLTEAECMRILSGASHGVLALAGDEGYPYAVPISFALSDGRIVFHSALSGHKIDAVRRSGKASFCVVAEDDVVPEKYTTRYCSVIAFGRIAIVEDEDRKLRDIAAIALKYAPSVSRSVMDDTIRQSWNAFHILELDIEHITGKVSRLQI